MQLFFARLWETANWNQEKYQERNNKISLARRHLSSNVTLFSISHAQKKLMTFTRWRCYRSSRVGNRRLGREGIVLVHIQDGGLLKAKAKVITVVPSTNLIQKHSESSCGLEITLRYSSSWAFIVERKTRENFNKE